MDLNATPFRAFLKVAELGSFTRAAEELHISQPALSANIKEFERRLGFPLFNRNSRRVTLTREGRAFAVSAKRVVLETEWMSQRVRDIRINELRIAVQHHSILIPERVALTDDFMDAYPHRPAMQVLSLEHARLYEAMRNDDADIAIVIEPSERNELSPINPNIGSDFEVEILARKPLGLLVPERHALCGCDVVDPAALQGYEVATINRLHGAAMASSVMRHLADLGVEEVRPPEADALSLIRYAVRRQILAVDLGWFTKIPGFGMEQLKSLRFEEPGYHSELIMLRRRRDQHRPGADLFWHYALGRRDGGAAETTDI